MEMILCFFPLVSKQVNEAVVAIISIIYMQDCVFNLMSRTNETRHTKWYETCKCKCRLDGSLCNNKQCWNEDKCRCECKELGVNT